MLTVVSGGKFDREPAQKDAVRYEFLPIWFLARTYKIQRFGPESR